MSRTSAYNLRNRLAGTPFALGWEVALECGMHQLAHVLMDRAVNGIEVEHYYHGELVAKTKRFDNRLAQWILGNPWKVGRHQIAREYASDHFDALLERIEWASLDWEDDERPPAPAMLGENRTRTRRKAPKRPSGASRKRPRPTAPPAASSAGEAGMPPPRAGGKGESRG